MPKYLVSICVPTYNRSARLAQFLKAFVTNLATSGSNECQLCVSDNHSSDGTLKLLEDCASRHSHIKYGSNAGNLGFGRNLYAAARLADGDYVYFCGDDDLLRSDTLPLLTSFAKQQHDLVIFNSYPGARLKVLGTSNGQSLHLANTADYFKRLGTFHASFIGNLFFRRETFLGIDPGLALSLSAYPHMIPVLKLLARGRAIFVNAPVVDWIESPRPWQPLQPIYTSVDMARLITENVDWTGAPWLRQSVYARLLRSLPKAIWRSNANQTPDSSQNPYGSVSRRNILEVYKPTAWCALSGAALASVLPIVSPAKWFGPKTAKDTLHRL